MPNIHSRCDRVITTWLVSCMFWTWPACPAACFRAGCGFIWCSAVGIWPIIRDLPCYGAVETEAVEYSCTTGLCGSWSRGGLWTNEGMCGSANDSCANYYFAVEKVTKICPSESVNILSAIKQGLFQPLQWQSSHTLLYASRLHSTWFKCDVTLKCVLLVWYDHWM